MNLIASTISHERQRRMNPSDPLTDAVHGSNLIRLAAQEQHPMAFLTPAEYLRLVDSLNGIRDCLLAGPALTRQDRDDVAARFDWLETASQRLPRGDWLYLCIGVLLTVAHIAALNPHHAGELFHEAGARLAGIFEAPEHDRGSATR